MNAKLLAASISLAMVAPVGQASIISILDDPYDIFPEPPLELWVYQWQASTTPDVSRVGTDIQVSLTPPMASHGFYDISYDAPNETLGFTFTNQIDWGGDAYYYRYLLEPGGGVSDLFVIQGRAHTTPDVIWFVSDPGSMALPPLIPGSTATPIHLPDIVETGLPILMYDTGVDQYYVWSGIPESSSWWAVLLGVGGLVATRGKRLYQAIRG